MSEVTLDDDLLQIQGRPLVPAYHPIMVISQWVERYSVMAALMTSSHFPNKTPELLAMIVQAEWNYEGKWCVTYDRQGALARKDLNWSVLDPRLYNEAFTGTSHSKVHIYCLQDNHAGPRRGHGHSNSYPLPQFSANATQGSRGGIMRGGAGTRPLQQLFPGPIVSPTCPIKLFGYQLCACQVRISP